MKFISCACIFIVFIGLNSCAVLKESPKYKLQDGFYKSKISENKKVTIYVDNNDTSINIYLAAKNKRLINLDSLPKSSLSLPQQFSATNLSSHIFSKATLDIDFLTLPFKYRPAQQNLPRQFNTSLNGAVYLGFRNDIFRLKYNRDPSKRYERETNHYGFSYGIFTGLGGTVMNPSTANSHITYEYDGVVWSKGFAGIIAVNNFTVGIAIGIDALLDKNHIYWDFQQKPWLGLALGLNLN